MYYKRYGLSPERRFMYKIWPRGDCWEFKGRKEKGGYPQFAVTPDETFPAHRVSYFMAKGIIPVGLEIDHICGHRWCVRPTHLEAVTRLTNARRGKNARKTCCLRGHSLADAIVWRGKRSCRVCAKDKYKRYRQRKREGVVAAALEAALGRAQ